MNSSDSKSIFGVLVGLLALFLLWLWASGNAAALWAVASGTPAKSTTGADKVAANVVGGNAAPLGGVNVATGVTPTNYISPTATVAAVTVPQYINTTPAITTPSSQSIGGLTFAGAQSGGVSITPTALLNTFSVPSTTAITSTATPISASQQNVSNWLLNVLDPLGIGGGAAAESNASWGTYTDPSDTSSWGTYNDPAGNIAGTSADTGTAIA